MTTGTADNSHADRKVAKRKRTCYPYSISDAIARIDEREAESLEYGDYPHKRATRFEEGEREPE